MFLAEMDWIVANRDVQNIRAVVSLGDEVDCPSATQFSNADLGYGKLDAADIVYSPLLGNHDYDGIVHDQTYGQHYAHQGDGID